MEEKKKRSEERGARRRLCLERYFIYSLDRKQGNSSEAVMRGGFP